MISARRGMGKQRCRHVAALLALVSLAQFVLGSAFVPCAASGSGLGPTRHGDCGAAHATSHTDQRAGGPTGDTPKRPDRGRDSQTVPCCVALASCAGATLATLSERSLEHIPGSSTPGFIEPARSGSPTYQPNPPPPRHTVV